MTSIRSGDLHQELLRQGQSELRAARSRSKAAFWAAVLFSVFTNLLLLSAPLYMLQIYDRVLISRSEPTLVALSLLMCFLFVIMGLLDHARGRILARIGARLQDLLDRRVLAAAFQRLAVAPFDADARMAQSDLETLARFWASSLVQSLLDLPWTPLFIAALFVFHPLLGGFALVAALGLTALALANQRATQTVTQEATLAGFRAQQQVDDLKAESELVRALGMTGAAFARWQKLRQHALAKSMLAADAAGGFAVLSKTLRLFLQSAILGLGAWLVLRGSLSPGAMIAGSILLGRALQPIEGTISQWPVLIRARAADRRLARLLSAVGPALGRMALPRPTARVEVSGLTLTAPAEARPILRGLSLAVGPGQAIGVIGISGAGKSALARALCGVWPPAAGHIRLDGATLDQYPPDVLGSCIGYLPQRVTLFEGTIAENIARLEAGADAARIVEAAQKAAVHAMILRLPKGYDTAVSALGGQLSGGQIQRIGLARAFYGDPVMLVLDEPNSNLDHEGAMALNEAIRRAKAQGCAVFIMAHRPAAILECELLLVLKDGMVQQFGPRDQVLREAVSNAAELGGAVGPEGQGGPGAMPRHNWQRGPR